MPKQRTVTSPEGSTSGAWLDTKQMCAALGISRQHLRHLIASGDVRASDISSPGSSRPTYRFAATEPARFNAARAVQVDQAS